MQTSETKPQADGDILFRRMVIWFTALSLAVTYGWLAGFVRQADGDFTFHWRWMALTWAFIGLASTFYFWRKIWPPGNNAATRRGIIEGTFALALPGIWWLILPLRAQSGQHLWQVVEGLTAAILVLTFGAWMIFRLGKAFEDDKEAE
jgi:FtsH-binding integral membrane protein